MCKLDDASSNGCCFRFFVFIIWVCFADDCLIVLDFFVLAKLVLVPFLFLMLPFSVFVDLTVGGGTTDARVFVAFFFVVADDCFFFCFFFVNETDFFLLILRLVLAVSLPTEPFAANNCVFDNDSVPRAGWNSNRCFLCRS